MIDEDTFLNTALSVVMISQTRRPEEQEIVMPGATYEGWYWVHGHYIFSYIDGWLSNVSEPNESYELTAISVGELWQWGVLEPLWGHYSTLSRTECPQCDRVSYLGGDYICHECRSVRDAVRLRLLRA